MMSDKNRSMIRRFVGTVIDITLGILVVIAFFYGLSDCMMGELAEGFSSLAVVTVFAGSELHRVRKERKAKAFARPNVLVVSPDQVPPYIAS